MASAFGHAFAGFAIARAGAPNPLWLQILLPVCAVLPDADMIAFRLGIPYADPFGHRGFTHSLLFAALVATALTLALGAGRRGLVFLLGFLATVSHGLLDAMTTGGGLGVGFFIPFSNRRYFLPWRPILVSPAGIERFFTARGWTILQNEALWIGVPCVAMMLMTFLWRTYWAPRRS